MIDRIKQTIEYSQLSASAFADTIGISRSGLTHLLTGRNQPSLDVARKILAKFPEISTEWLIMGMGDMLRSDEPVEQHTVATGTLESTGEQHRAENSKFGDQHDLFAEFVNSDDSEQDDEEDVGTEESTEYLESAEDEQDMDSVPASATIPEPVEASVAPVRTPTPQSRPRKPASEPKPAPARRERHLPAPAQEKKLQKIVFFYDDHSFEVFNG